MKEISRFFISIFAVLLFTACNSSTTKTVAVKAPTPASKERGNLTQTAAAARARLLQNISYKLDVGVDATADEFSDMITIAFELNGAPEPLSLDFRSGANISQYIVNGASVAVATTGAAANYVDGSLQIPIKALKTGANTINISYRRKYSTDGTGLYRFSDPEDNRVYLYSQFEAFDANQMFPCFDQPDLKATFTMDVSAPADWEIISTTRESAIKVTAKERKTWSFPKTPPISTYLFSLHAGPYAKWSSSAGSIPLRLFARQSLKKYVVPNEWFIPTQEGLRFYGQLFDYPYPFKKFDQIIVPDFNAGAMENVAAITYSEHYVRRGPSTREEREGLAGTILHEMAHQWFGDLVTMQWWNGLWLNESFATYMSTLASDKATEFKDAWMEFFGGVKTWAYTEDQWVTTHPINGTVPDTDSSFANFDGITYGKGASVLKQLSYYIGEDHFRDGLRLYFKTYAYQNTTLADFIKALEKTSKKDLSVWSSLWFEQAGVDTVEAKYDCTGDKITSFELDLTPPAATPNVLRPHRTTIGLFRRQGAKVILLKKLDVDYQGPSTRIPALVGLGCPLMVYPNVDDNDYVKVRLDDRTLLAIRDSLSDISDSFQRFLFWPSLFEMVRDAKLKPLDYLRMVERALPRENDVKILRQVMASLTERHGTGTAFYYLPQATQAERQAFHDELRTMEDLVWKKVGMAAPLSDEQKALIDAYTLLVQTREGAKPLAMLLNPGRSLKGWTLDEDRRWNVVERLNSIGYEHAAEAVEIEEVRDSSERGIQAKFASEASRPTLENKQTWIKRVIEDRDLSLARTRTILRSLLPAWQNEFRWALANQYYATLPALTKTRDLEFVDDYGGALLPTVCTNESAAKLQAFIAAHPKDLPPTIMKNLRIGLQEDQRCVKIRGTAGSAP